MRRRGVIAIWAGAVLALVAGFGGALHPAGDSLAVFRWPLLALALGLSVALPGRLRWMALWLGALLLGAMLRPVLAPDWDGAPRITLYQQNMLFSRRDYAAWLAAVEATAPDVLTVQEVSVPNRAALAALEARYPHQLFCGFPRLSEAVLSRYAFVPGTSFCPGDDGLALVQVETPHGALWVGSVHLNWPWPLGQAPQRDRLLPDLARISGPAVIAGDFNAVAWSHTVKAISDASGTRRIGRRMATFALPYGGLPVGIDHVLASAEGRVTRMPRLGSDHFGLLVELDPWPTRAETTADHSR